MQERLERGLLDGADEASGGRAARGVGVARVDQCQASHFAAEALGEEAAERQQNHAAHAVPNQQSNLTGGHAEDSLEVVRVPLQAVVTVLCLLRVAQPRHIPHDDLETFAEGSYGVVPRGAVGAAPMGNREALLSGAKKSLLEKGYDRTTVRDITAAAGGVSMAAIGYHFGSREALLTAALVEALDEWGAAALGSTLARGGKPKPPDRSRYRRWWASVIESFRKQRPLWLASVEAFLQAERSPDVGEQLARGNQDARRGLAAWLLGIPEDDVSDDVARSIGSVQVALISGLMIQWLNDPAHAPSAADVERGVRELAARIA